jgi:hypothetical protein
VPSVDYNRSGSVGLEDYNLWRSMIGHTLEPGVAADGNGDRIVDAADYVLWRNEFDREIEVRAGPANQIPSDPPFATPEPATSTLVAILLIMAAPSRACRRTFRW